MTTTKRISAIVLGTLLLAAAAAGASAQSEHEGHHPKDAPIVDPPQPSLPKEVAPAPAPGEGMGMMGCNDMSKMMQGMHGAMMGNMPAGPKGDTGPASQALDGAITKMQAAIASPYSGDADVDFTKRLIVHYQGAVDIAKVELAFGKDTAAKAVAEQVIKTNEADIAKLQEWLKSRGQ